MNKTDIWGYLAPLIVWLGDHWTAIGAFILFLLQVIYQLIRIRNEARNGLKNSSNSRRSR